MCPRPPYTRLDRGNGPTCGAGGVCTCSAPVLVAASPTRRCCTAAHRWKSSRDGVWLALTLRAPCRRISRMRSGGGYAAGHGGRLICVRWSDGPGAPPGVSFADWLAGAPSLRTRPLRRTWTCTFNAFPPSAARPRRGALQSRPGRDDWVVPVACSRAGCHPRRPSGRQGVPAGGRRWRRRRIGSPPAIAKAAVRCSLAPRAAQPVGPGPVLELVDTFSQTLGTPGAMSRRRGSPGRSSPKGDSRDRRTGPCQPGRQPCGRPGPNPLASCSRQLPAQVVAELTAAAPQHRLTEAVDEADLVRQHSPLMSPLVWTGHIGSQRSSGWSGTSARGAVRPETTGLYDAFQHSRASASSCRCSPRRRRAHTREVREKALDALERSPCGAAGSRARLRFGMIGAVRAAAHETSWPRTSWAPAPVLHAEPPPSSTGAPVPAECWCRPAFSMGTSTEPWALDNERPAHRVELPAM